MSKGAAEVEPQASEAPGPTDADGVVGGMNRQRLSMP
jgi:hypothetical protein